MNRAIDTLFAIVFALLALGFALWAVLQDMGALPLYNVWSDLAAYLIALCFGACAWMSACTRYVVGSRF
jgi:hypothetical protein